MFFTHSWGPRPGAPRRARLGSVAAARLRRRWRSSAGTRRRPRSHGFPTAGRTPLSFSPLFFPASWTAETIRKKSRNFPKSKAEPPRCRQLLALTNTVPSVAPAAKKSTASKNSCSACLGSFLERTRAISSANSGKRHIAFAEGTAGRWRRRTWRNRASWAQAAQPQVPARQLGPGAAPVLQRLRRHLGPAAQGLAKAPQNQLHVMRHGIPSPTFGMRFANETFSRFGKLGESQHALNRAPLEACRY